MKPEFIQPNWPAPANVRALATTRIGGSSTGPYASFNLGDHVGDAATAVTENRARLHRHLPAEPLWLHQVHGTHCVDASQAIPGAVADAAFTRTPDTVCAVLTADCLPLLLCDNVGSVVAAAHAGWRGLAAGVIEATVESMAVPGENVLAWLGPAIGPQHFEVGEEVRAAFMSHDLLAAAAFVAQTHDQNNGQNGQSGGKWLCDITLLARQRLAALGVHRITSADFCTVRDTARFFSYRRDGPSGRMASLIWLSSATL